jgi:hypothetical protein
MAAEIRFGAVELAALEVARQAGVSSPASFARTAMDDPAALGLQLEVVEARLGVFEARLSALEARSGR